MGILIFNFKIKYFQFFFLDFYLSQLFTSSLLKHFSRYHESSQMSSLVETFVSKASALQRQGRAGRVRDGFCFRMYTRERYGIAWRLKTQTSVAFLDNMCLGLFYLIFQIWRLYGLFCPWNLARAFGGIMSSYYGNPKAT